MSQYGYYRHPTVSDERVVFVCEDDLWSLPLQGGLAIRLTANLAQVQRPLLSPDGLHLAFVGREEGHAEVYCMPAVGGMARRLTFMGSAKVAGWSPGGEIVFVSSAQQPIERMDHLYSISPQGGQPQLLPYGLAHSVAFGSNGRVVIGRNTDEPAYWKRYRGGKMGVLWVDAAGNGQFRKLIEINGNLDSPIWIGERIYFLSDHEGIGNLYSCTPTGEDLQPHTQHRDYYARNASSDGQTIVYHAGAELFRFDPLSPAISQPIPVQFHSPRLQRQRKFVNPAEFLEDYGLHPDGHSVVITSRGKSFCFGNWEGAVFQLGQPENQPAGRYRLTQWLNDGQRLVGVCDRSGIETLEILSPEFDQSPLPLTGLDIGRVEQLAVSPVADQLVLTNHRQELIWVDLVSAAIRQLDRSDYDAIQGFCWSPDGEWVAYGMAEVQHTVSIKLCQVESGTTHLLTPPRFRDTQPAFDPAGRFIYFLSVREFNPVYDRVYFDLSFPKAMRPFLIALQAETASPFGPVTRSLSASLSPIQPDIPEPEPELSEAADTAPAAEEPPAPAERTPAEPTSPAPLNIDFEGIQQRILGFPVAEGIYGQIHGLEGKVLLTTFPVQSSLVGQQPKEKPSLELYDFESQKQERLAEANDFRLAKDQKTLIYRAGYRLRVCEISSLSSLERDRKEAEPGRKSGWLDLNRVRLSVNPEQEWPQMFREAWRLQQEQFWTADLSGVDWLRVFERYRPLLERIGCRSELSDLIWEMQGELGTSHAYEGGGDYRESPQYPIGFLGADFSYDPDSDAYRVERIIQGDAWSEQGSPLSQLGVNVRVGDLLLAIDGQPLSRYLAPQELLVNRARSEVALTFAGAGSAAGSGADQRQPPHRTITVKTLRSETPLRYRAWVEANHQQVQAATDGQIGYLHIPDMGPAGYAEFHRYYFAEVYKNGLIIDLRYNRGGFVSQLILEKLARRRLGYDVTRWSKPVPFPFDSVAGPMVAITDEYAASDGDIFSHCFKLMQLGKLIGKRTWGGVIGFSNRQALVDQSQVTQPEFSFWFKDVGWQIENYGTVPDIEVEITPQDWAEGRDSQLEKAIEVILHDLAENPVALPDFGARPHLPLPS